MSAVVQERACTLGRALPYLFLESYLNQSIHQYFVVRAIQPVKMLITVCSMTNSFKATFLHFVQKWFIISKEYNILRFFYIDACHPSSFILATVNPEVVFLLVENIWLFILFPIEYYEIAIQNDCTHFHCHWNCRRVLSALYSHQHW